MVNPRDIAGNAEKEEEYNNNNNNNDFISKALFHVKHAQLRCTMSMNNTHTHEYPPDITKQIMNTHKGLVYEHERMEVTTAYRTLNFCGLG